jgi:predicted phage terminase large subunit-like protein
LDDRVSNLCKTFIKHKRFDKALDVLEVSCAEDLKGTYPLLLSFRRGLTRMAKMGDGAAMKLLRRSYFMTASRVFDDFCIAMEWERPPSQRFYLPRRKQLYPIAREMQKLTDDELDFLGLSMPPGTGKALADDTPILTRNGWKNHGDLVVGDEVIGLNGEFKKVIHVHPKCTLDRLVTFSNGEKIQCHERHEWETYSRGAAKYILAETQEYEKRCLEYGGEAGVRGHRYAYQLPPRCVIGEEKDLFSPYLLGVWLGDGTNRTPTITNHINDYAIIEKIHSQGYFEKHKYTQDRQPGTVWYVFDIRKHLSAYGMCKDKRRTPKHIPSEYLTASIDQRLELLAGLIDTDGCVVGNKYKFSTCDIELRDTFIELISTFGWRSCVSVYAPRMSTSGICGKKEMFVVSFTPDRFIPCALERKRVKTTRKQRMLAMVSVEKTTPRQGNCITVEGDGMYLAGKTLIPTHNSAMETFFLCFTVGRNPLAGNLIGSHNNSFLRGLYEEVIRMLDPDGEYCWHEIFPKSRIVKTNALDMKIDVDKPQRFSSFQFRSIQGGNAGLARAIGLLVCDDLIEGIEEAMSEERLEAKWTKFNTDLLQRTQGECKTLMIATRWSVRDPLGRLEADEVFQKNHRCKFINIPALDKRDRSNFDYGGTIGFTSSYYKALREIMDDASFAALYMGQPVERTGILYPTDELQRFFDLPTEEPDAVLAVCDTKNKGDDYFCMPIAYQYGDKFYIVSILCDNKTPEVVDPRLVNSLLNYGVKMARFESNSAGGRIAENVQNKIKDKGGITKIVTKYSTANKETRIIVDSAFVKEHFLFRDTSKYDAEYRVAMNFLVSYTMSGKNRHDDVPDAMSMLADFVQTKVRPQAIVMKRPF